MRRLCVSAVGVLTVLLLLPVSAPAQTGPDFTDFAEVIPTHHADRGAEHADGEVKWDAAKEEYYVAGNGWDIQQDGDECFFVYRKISGSFRIEADLEWINAPHEWAKAGLMVRETTDGDSVQTNIVTSGSPGMPDRYEEGSRLTTQAAYTTSWDNLPEEMWGLPTRLAITRIGANNMFIREYFDIVTEEWVKFPIVIEAMPEEVLVGLAASSHIDDENSWAEAWFRNVVVDEDFVGMVATRLLPTVIYETEQPVTILIEIEGDAGTVELKETPPSGWAISDISDGGSASGGTISWSFDFAGGAKTITYNVTPPSTATGMVDFSGQLGEDDVYGNTQTKVAALLPLDELEKQDITTGLEGHWTFDEGSGMVAADSCGKGRDADFRNGEATWVDGIKGKALQFDGDDDLAVTGYFGVDENKPRTVSYWLKTDWAVGASSGCVGWGFSTENGAKWHTRLNQTAGNGTVGAIRTEIQGNYFIGSTPLNDGNWHHVASVFPEGGFVMEDVIHYVDGIEDPMSGTNTGNADIEVWTAGEDWGTEVEIGSRLQGTSQQYYIGLLDEIRIYSRALSLAEIQAILVAEGGGPPTAVESFMLY